MQVIATKTLQQLRKHDRMQVITTKTLPHETTVVWSVSFRVKHEKAACGDEILAMVSCPT